MRELAPDVLGPGHGPVCHGEDVATLLARWTPTSASSQDVAAESYAAGLTPLEAAQKHRDNPYSDWAETERFVGNLHRAYSELAGNPIDTRLTVAVGLARHGHLPRRPDRLPRLSPFHAGWSPATPPTGCPSCCPTDPCR